MRTESKSNKTRQRSAGVVVLRDRPDHCGYLLMRAYSHRVFSKGLPETGEQAIAAARREVEEETGITQLDFRWGYDYFETGHYLHGKIARYYSAATSQPKVERRISQELGRLNTMNIAGYPSRRVLSCRACGCNRYLNGHTIRPAA